MSVVRYRFRLRPGAVALAGLGREWDRCRWVWNQAVARLNESGEWVRDDALASWRREHDWLWGAVRHSDLLEVRVHAESEIPGL